MKSHHLTSQCLLFVFLLFSGCKKVVPTQNPGSPVIPVTTGGSVTPPVLTTTAASLITSNSATSGGTIQSEGGTPVIKRGICWGQTHNPDTAVTTKILTTGTGTGSFQCSLTGLLPNTTYYIRAVAYNSAGLSYGAEVSFMTSASTTTTATITTIPANIITANGAWSGGNITSDGGIPIISRGVCYSTSPSPTIANPKTIDGAGTGSFISHLTGLLPNTTYYLKAYATNSSSVTVYGDSISFTTAVIPGYKMYGIGFSPYYDGQSPDYGTQISQAQITYLLQKISPYTNWIRIYGSVDGLENIGGIAHQFGLKVAAGAWLSNDLVNNQVQIANLIAQGLAGKIDVAVVGNEVLLRGDLTKAQLIGYINQVKAALPGIPVTTGDVYQTFLTNPDLVNAVDIIFVHIYPLWERISISCAVNFVHIAYKSVQAVSQGKEVVVAETGWASGGSPIGNAIPSLPNANTYFLGFVSWARQNNVKYFYFSSFDEQWKIAHEGDVGPNWGIWYKNGGSLKPNMQRVFNGEIIPNSWALDTIAILSNPPSLHFTTVPPLGSFQNLEGIARGVLPSLYRVVVYIYISGGWWIKPTFTDPVSRINCDGSFVCDITTGGEDQNATRIYAFTIPASYSPPLLAGAPVIPPELAINSVASLEVLR